MIEKEKTILPSPENRGDSLIKESLKSELQKMEERWRGVTRTDSKYIILKKFLIELESHLFKDAFASLLDHEKHAIITRLQNQTKRFGGALDVGEVRKLEEEVYGTIIYRDKKRINSARGDELERKLQEMNAHLYK